MKQKSEKSMNENLLTPRQESVKISGKLNYSEGSQAWNTIRLKKDVFKEFPQLKEKRGCFGYQMIIPKSQEELKKVFSEVKGVVPILLFFKREESN